MEKENFVCKVFRPFESGATDNYQVFLGQRQKDGILSEITATLFCKHRTEEDERDVPLQPFLKSAQPEMLQAFSQALYDAGFKPKGVQIIETEKTLLREIIDMSKDESKFYRKLISNDEKE
ncbi:MAG: hypothetical protein WC479_07125 [Candidatus Izemoplasmatales bacterium]|jgi:hypothetical protein